MFKAEEAEREERRKLESKREEERRKEEERIRLEEEREVGLVAFTDGNFEPSLSWCFSASSVIAKLFGIQCYYIHLLFVLLLHFYMNYSDTW